MIARIWHGYTSPENADAYGAMLKPEPLPGLSKIEGYRGSYVLRRNSGSEVEFITILLWDSIETIRAVAGPVRNGGRSRATPQSSQPLRCQGPALRSRFNTGNRSLISEPGSSRLCCTLAANSC